MTSMEEDGKSVVCVDCGFANVDSVKLVYVMARIMKNDLFYS